MADATDWASLHWVAVYPARVQLAWSAKTALATGLTFSAGWPDGSGVAAGGAMTVDEGAGTAEAGAGAGSLEQPAIAAVNTKRHNAGRSIFISHQKG